MKGYKQIDIPEKISLWQRLRGGKPVPEVIPFVPRGRVLDIGCGNGEYLVRLKSIGWDCQGVEFNAKAVSICRSLGLEVFHGDLHSARFEPATFDFVTANHLIEHVPDPHELMSEIARVTKPGGTVIIRTPNSRAIGRGWLNSYWFANEVPRHLMLYSRDNLERLAAQYGLQLTSVRTPVKPKILLRSIDYLIGNKGTPSEDRPMRRLFGKLYTPFAKLPGRGDELFATFRKA